MCYNKSQDAEEEELSRRYKRRPKDKFVQTRIYFNGFGTPQVNLIKQEEKDVFGSAYWGFVPGHVKTEAEAREFRTNYLTLNAKSETVFQLPTYKSSIMPRRCIIPVTGFFESRHMDPKGKLKIPYFIHLKEEPIFSLAGIYGYYTNEHNETKCTYSVLTTAANPLMEKIHNSKKRMPLILDREMEEIWLDPGLNEKQVKEMFRIFDEKKMDAHPIAKISPKTTNFSSRQMLEKVDYAEIQD